MSNSKENANPASVGIDVDENALVRWSRRKEMARQGKPLPEPDDAPDDSAEEAGDHEIAATTETGDVCDADDARAEPPELPPLESLSDDSDYSAFLASGVAPDVQRQALRRLFHSPKFNLRDGLDDYDLDYTNPEPLGNIVTAEMRRRILREIERLADADSDDETTDGKVALAEDVGEAERRETIEPAEAQPEGDEDADDDRPAAS